MFNADSLNTFSHNINRDEQLRREGLAASLLNTLASMIDTAADLLDGQRGAGRAEKTLAQEIMERQGRGVRS